MAAEGHHVRVYCRAKDGFPDREIVNGVEYVRIKFQLNQVLWKLLFGRSKSSPRPTAAHTSFAAGLAGRAGKKCLRSQTAAAPSMATTAARRILRFFVWLAKRTVANGVKVARASLVPFHKMFVYKAFSATFGPHIEDWKPDVIHAHDLIPLPMAVEVARKTGAKVIYDAHELETHRNPPLPPHIRYAVERVERRNIVKADAVFTVCDPIADFLRDKYRIARPHVVMNAPQYPPTSERKGNFILEDTRLKGADSHWRQSGGHIDRLRDLAGVSDDKILAVYVGLVTINRGLETVIEALPKLPEVTLVTVGPTNPASVEKLKEMAERIGVTDRFKLVPAVPVDMVIDCVSSATFGVCPIWPLTKSYNWALPNKLFEMTFAGLPIVASDTEEVSRFLNENDLGLIYKYNDAEDCASKIRTLLDDFESYRVSTDKKEQIRQKYSWPKQASVVKQVYETLLSSSDDARPQVGATTRQAS